MNKPTKIFIANDHAGFLLANFLIKNNPQQNWEHLGIFNQEKTDYPKQATILCNQVLKYSSQNLNTPICIFGILICGSGQGMAIKANRFTGIRAALAENQKNCELARLHNNVNVLCLGSRLISFTKANNIFTTFIQTPFEGGRHLNRIESIDKND